MAGSTDLADADPRGDHTDPGSRQAFTITSRPGPSHADPSGSDGGVRGSDADTDPGRRPAAGARIGPRVLLALVALVRNPGLAGSILVIGVVLAWAVVPGWFSHQNPLQGVTAQRLQAPSSRHLFGTDHLGRDLYARMVHGAALSLEATVVAVLVAVLAGAVVGTVAGYLQGWIDTALMRVMDVLLAIPGLLLALAVVSAIGFGVIHVAIAVGVVSVASYARVMRAQVLVVREVGYVEAARGGGARGARILLTHVIPNAAGPLLALAALDVGTVLLTVSALSFLGFGAEPPTPEWGALVASGEPYLYAAWWLTTFPGLTVAAVVLSTNRIARALETDSHH
ncbi:peptide/nickel transport system permease protein [Frankia sp. AiPs1]|uniref:ABC transporter permease n=1 Tax=Frankia sp. AiPa1 TaxID=573492 RepID=UPI00202B356C|nr:ABC transporter permease [Frankia sp. AiPa1]MCL9760514.1 ABC transporter permease [Frankia sp. AiPa1]